MSPPPSCRLIVWKPTSMTGLCILLPAKRASSIPSCRNVKEVLVYSVVNGESSLPMRSESSSHVIHAARLSTSSANSSAVIAKVRLRLEPLMLLRWLLASELLMRLVRLPMRQLLPLPLASERKMRCSVLWRRLRLRCWRRLRLRQSRLASCPRRL